MEPDADDIRASTTMVIEDDGPDSSSLIHMYAAFNLPPAKPVCKTALSAVQDFANLLSTEGKESLKINVKEIAKSVLSSTDPNVGLDTEEARVCIEETAVRAQESTAASRLTDAFPIANPTREVRVHIDPSQLRVNEGPQHHLLTTSLMDEIITMFDPKHLANIPWDDDRMDYEHRVKLNFQRLETNWRDLRDSNIEMSRVINNPISDLIINQLGRDERLYRLGRLNDVEHWKLLGGGLGAGTVRKKVTLSMNNTMKATQVATTYD